MCDSICGPFFPFESVISLGLGIKQVSGEKQLVDPRFQARLACCLQLMEKALLVVTSRVPIAVACLQQYKLGGISEGSCTWLMRQAAPDLDGEELTEAVQLCKGVPLIVRLIGDAFASGRLTLQVTNHCAQVCPPGRLAHCNKYHQGEALLSLSQPSCLCVQDMRATISAGDQTAATVRLIIHSLPRQQQHSLSHLAVFPSCFDVEGAAAVQGWNESRARAILSVGDEQHIYQFAVNVIFIPVLKPSLLISLLITLSSNTLCPCTQLRCCTAMASCCTTPKKVCTSCTWRCVQQP